MKKITTIFLAVFIMLGSVFPVVASSPYLGYSYNFWAQPIPAPVSYLATRTISALDICVSLGPFVNPTDVSVSDNGHIYLLDGGNNRVVVFDQELNLIRVIDSFVYNGQTSTFNNPGGVFVCVNFYIYIADTDNRRVVILDTYGNFVNMIQDPDLGDIDDVVDFRPARVVADSAGRVYVIVMHVFEGIMRFDTNGDFFGYFGTINVRVSAADLFWRMVSTAEQRARQRRFIPTEFTGLDVDEYGFIFATHSGAATSGDQVMRLNPRGNDIFRNLNDNVGIRGAQIFSGSMWDQSSFIDIVARPYGKFSALDSTRNRVYTYDSEGNLLYVFSGEGSIMGMSRRPVAIDVIGDNIIVLDALRGRLIYFEPTEYGQLINEAIALRYQGDEAASVEIWQQVMLLNEHSELAFTGVGRAHLLNGEYTLAMDYLRRGMDLRYYSMALARRRELFIGENLPFVLTGGVLLAVVLAVRSVYKKWKYAGFDEDGAI